MVWEFALFFISFAEKIYNYKTFLTSYYSGGRSKICQEFVKNLTFFFGKAAL